MGDAETPVTIGSTGDAAPPTTGAALGQASAATLAYLIGVIDREDRLESGTGRWRSGFVGDAQAAEASVRQSVLRALHMASDPANFEILETVVREAGTSPGVLSSVMGLGRLSVSERVSDLVSAGLVAKLPEADQVVPTPAGAELVGLVREAVAAGKIELEARTRCR